MKTHKNIERFVFLSCDKTKQQLSAAGNAEEAHFYSIG